MCHRIGADKNNNCGQRQSRQHTSGCREIIHITVLHFISFIFDALSMACRPVSGNVSICVMAECVVSSERSASSPQRSLTSSPSQSSCWFSDVETGPDKASHQMSSGWEIGFDAVPFKISCPSLWHIDGIYVSQADSRSNTRRDLLPRSATHTKQTIKLFILNGGEILFFFYPLSFFF